MKRREFMLALGGVAAAWPLAARAQQPALPVIGFLNSLSAERWPYLAAFHHGLKEAGYVEGQNVSIEDRWADGHYDRLPALAVDLMRRRVDLIVATGGDPSALAAKAATTTTPIVFLVGEDPTRLGLVTSLARPSGNLTGINMLSNELEAKRLQLLHQLVPQARRIAVLVSPANVTNAEMTLRDVEAAARTIGLQLQVLKANTAREIEEGFAWSEQKPDAIFVGAAAFLNIHRVRLVQLAAFHHLPATYGQREAAEAGGLMSYGPSIFEAYRQWGSYAGRVLKGAKPTELPVVQSTKFELVINNMTARMFGLTVPPSLLAIADEVIE